MKNTKDEIRNQKIFELRDKIITTGNIMGFVGINNTQLIITSRFADNDQNDYFLHYMLQKVMNINIFNFTLNESDKDKFYDFLLYFFPHYLEKALNQGLYKEYHRNEYNNSNIRGTIDVKRHIKLNLPFTGEIAYTMREYTYDNPVMQLIRHTIEYIKTHSLGNHILNSNPDIIENVNKIIFHTDNYNKNNRQKILNFNIKKTVTHPYFHAYKDLQRICIRILQKDKISIGEKKNKVYGLLFDGAWLWEEYLNKVFTENNLGFTHAENKTGKKPIYLFEDNTYRRYPDFYKKNLFMLDAKYKRLLDKDKIDRDDIHQIISYMYVEKAMLGGFIHPTERLSMENPRSIGFLKGYNGEIKIWSLYIPQNSSNFEDFRKSMKNSENELLKQF